MASNIFTSSHQTQISIARIKTKSTLQHAQKHNDREKERLGESTGIHVDGRRTVFNDTLVASFGRDIWKEILSRVTGQIVTDEEDVSRISKSYLYYADGTKVRSDAVLAAEIEAGYPGDLMWHKIDKNGNPVPIPIGEVVDEECIRSVEAGGKGYFLWPADKKEFEEWKSRTLQFITEAFGENNILSVEVHVDESKPHIHAIVMPSYTDEKGVDRLSFHKCMKESPVGDLLNYYSLQSLYAERFSDMGYSRGEEYSGARHYSDRDEMRAIAAKVLSTTLPENRHEAETSYKSAIAKVADLEIELRNRKEQSKSLAKLIKEKKELEVKLAETEKELSRAKEAQSYRECELMGMKLHEDQEMINDIYKPLQESLVSAGQHYYEEKLNVKLQKDSREISRT